MQESERFKNLYNWMKQTGELSNFIPRSTGDWEKDKVKFIKYQTEMEGMANLTNTESDGDI